MRHLFVKYFKTAGGFCSKARKLVLSDINDEASIDSVLNTAKEMEDTKNRFLHRCKLSLRPWFDVSSSISHGKCGEPTKRVRSFEIGDVTCFIISIDCVI